MIRPSGALLASITGAMLLLNPLCCRAERVAFIQGLLGDTVVDDQRNALYVGMGSVVHVTKVNSELFWPDFDNFLGEGAVVDLSPNGNKLASGSGWNKINVLDLNGGQDKEFYLDFQSNEKGVSDIVFASDSELLVTTGCEEGEKVPFRRINIETGEITVLGDIWQQGKLSSSHDRSVVGIVSGKDGYWDAEGLPFIYDVGAGELRAGAKLPERAEKIATNHDGSRFAVTSANGVRLLDANLNLLSFLPSQSRYLKPNDVLFSPDGRVLYVTWKALRFAQWPNILNSVIAYDSGSLSKLEVLEQHNVYDFMNMAISGDGKELFVVQNYQYAYPRGTHVYDVSHLMVPEPSSVVAGAIGMIALWAGTPRRRYSN